MDTENWWWKTDSNKLSIMRVTALAAFDFEANRA